MMWPAWGLPAAWAQRYVAPCSRWVATVDESTQQIILRWSPTTDSLATGYHICSGDTCRQYAILHSRWDTSYVCTDHAPTTAHRYRLHVFDAEGNTSILSPSFGNIVLQAYAAACQSAVSIDWSACEGMYSGVAEYRLYAKSDPSAQGYELIATSDSAAPRHVDYVPPLDAQKVWFKVLAVGRDTLIQSTSNVVCVEREAADTSAMLRIDSLLVDSVAYQVKVLLSGSDSSEMPRSLWRSTNGGQWQRLAMLEGSPTEYTDRDIHPYRDTLLCYRTSLQDACNSDYAFSPQQCTIIPLPPQPDIQVPNALRLGDDANGTFRPYIAGVIGSEYQLFVYNRQGLCVFHTDSPAEAWHPSDTTPQGAYTYLLRVAFADGTIQTLYGTITLIK